MAAWRKRGKNSTHPADIEGYLCNIPTAEIVVLSLEKPDTRFFFYYYTSITTIIITKVNGRGSGGSLGRGARKREGRRRILSIPEGRHISIFHTIYHKTPRTTIPPITPSNFSVVLLPLAGNASNDARGIRPLLSRLFFPMFPSSGRP